MNVARRPVPLSDVKKRGGGFATDGGSSSTAASSATDVDMYLDVPSFELSLDEFEEYALARLKVCPIPFIIDICVVIFAIHYALGLI